MPTTHASEGFPLATGRTEATVSTGFITVFDLDEREGGAGPRMTTPTDERMAVRMVSAPVLLPVLRVQIEEAGDGDLGEELRRRDVLGRAADLGSGLALRDPEGVVDDGRREDLHGDGVGVGGVEAVEGEYLLEVAEHPLAAPAI